MAGVGENCWRRRRSKDICIPKRIGRADDEEEECKGRQRNVAENANACAIVIIGTFASSEESAYSDQRGTRRVLP